MNREIPGYRLRVFLAVDLAGSTAFKAKKSSNSWIRTFKGFYANFLKDYQAIYVEFCEENEECARYNEEEYFPKLWKTIGDEVIFVTCVSSQFHLFACVHAFDRALKQYREVLKSKEDTEELDVKGNGWIASFPIPNQTVSMTTALNEEFENELPDERHEANADQKPALFDFLGPGIDAGFRIARNSTPGFFTLSPMLAWLLCRANTNRLFSKFSFDLEFRGVNELKGVVEGAPYPIVGINTERNDRIRRIDRLKNEMLGGAEIDSNKLIEYLEVFAEQYRIDMPSLKTSESDASFEVPEFYTEQFIPDWKELDASLRSQDANLAESAIQDGEETEVERQNTEVILNDLARKLSEVFADRKRND